MEFPDSLELLPCDPAVHGDFIRTLTRANFFEAMKGSWNEARHQQEPTHPERYRMIARAGAVIGFFATRRERDFLYVQTIQLVEAARRHGLGTRLLMTIERNAAEEGARAVRLRVLRSNDGARRLYHRLGYVTIDEEPTSLVLEREVG